MKKRLFMFATAALMLAACSNDGEVAVNNGAQLQSGSGAVAFDTYTSSATKSGDAGIQTTATLQLTDKGFGVFAQYSDNGNYNNTTDPVANFMYNQQVKYSAGAWTYSPLKYWPNETVGDPQAATGVSAAKDKLSFFAYAPYVSGALSATGIDGMIANNAKDIDPWVSYTVATDPSQSVDLLWGVAPSGGLHYTDVAGNAVDVDPGKPLINLTKPDKDQKIKFLFQHALARLGLTIVAAFDQVAPGGTQGTGTKIAVKSIAITETTATKQLKTSGKLLLLNGTAWKSSWNGATGDVAFNITADMLNPAIAWKTSDADTYTDDDILGVTTTEQKVLKQTGTPAHDNYFMVIPGHADTELQVVITYAVITADANLNSGYSVVNNVITKKVTISELTNNKAYNLKLILGMTSVKLDAEVADWQVDGSTEVYLPQNAAE